MNVLDKLLFNLHTIASIPKGSRISTAKEFIIIEDDSIMQGVWRKMNADSRDKAVASICREIRTTIAIAYYIMESHHLFAESRVLPDDINCDVAISSTLPPNARDKRINDIKKIKAGLLGANHGIDAICQTYEDADVSGHLKPLIGEIVECSDHISRLLIELGICN